MPDAINPWGAFTADYWIAVWYFIGYVFSYIIVPMALLAVAILIIMALIMFGFKIAEVFNAN